MNEKQRVEEIRARVGVNSPSHPIFGTWYTNDCTFLLDLLREQQAEHIVKVKIGAGALTRDLVWCECGRGISAVGNWAHCPMCGGKIDQESYENESRKALGNEMYLYHDADLINQIAEQQAELEALRKDRETADALVKFIRSIFGPKYDTAIAGMIGRPIDAARAASEPRASEGKTDPCWSCSCACHQAGQDRRCDNCTTGGPKA